MKNRKTLNLRQTFSYIVLLFVLGAALFGVLMIRNFGKMGRLLKENEYNVLEFSEGLLHMNRVLGLGGLIQNYRDYLLTADISSYEGLKTSMDEVDKSINHIKMSEYITG